MAALCPGHPTPAKAGNPLATYRVDARNKSRHDVLSGRKVEKTIATGSFAPEPDSRGTKLGA